MKLSFSLASCIFVDSLREVSDMIANKAHQEIDLMLVISTAICW